MKEGDGLDRGEKKIRLPSLIVCLGNSVRGQTESDWWGN